MSVTASLALVGGAWADGGGHPDWANGSLGNVNRLAGVVRAEADKAKAAAVAAKAAQEKKDGPGADTQSKAARAAYDAAFNNYQEAAAHAGLCDGQARGCWGAPNVQHCVDKAAACQRSLDAARAALDEARDASFEAVKQGLRAGVATFVDVGAPELAAAKTVAAELRTLTEKFAEELKKDSEAAVAASGELGKAMDANEEMAPSLKKQMGTAVTAFAAALGDLDKLTNALKRMAIGALDDEDAANIKRLAIAIRAKTTLAADYKAALAKEGGAAAKFEADLSAAGIGAAADHFKNSREGFVKVVTAGERLLAAVVPVSKPNIAKRIGEETTKRYNKLVGDSKESLLKVVELVGKMKDQQSGDDGSSADTPPEEPAKAEPPKPADESTTSESTTTETTTTETTETKAEENADTPPEEKPAEEPPAEEKPAEESTTETTTTETTETKTEENADTPPEEKAAEEPPAEETTTTETTTTETTETKTEENADTPPEEKPEGEAATEANPAE